MSGALMKARAFVADLPDLSPEQLALAYGWCKKKFDQFDIHRCGEEKYVLVALCRKDEEGKTVRQWQSLIRTNLQNWHVTLPTTVQKGWLRAVSAEDYINAVGEAGNEPMGKNTTAESPSETKQELVQTALHHDSPVTSSYEEYDMAPMPTISANMAATNAHRVLLRLPSNLLYNGGEKFATLHERRPVAVY